jgi:hypothetical protein
MVMLIRSGEAVLMWAGCRGNLGWGGDEIGCVIDGVLERVCARGRFLSFSFLDDVTTYKGLFVYFGSRRSVLMLPMRALLWVFSPTRS